MCNSKKYCAALVVALYDGFGLSHKEICKQTGYPSNAVGNIISRRIGSRKDRGHIVRAGWSITETDNALIESIEREYLAGASSYELGEKYGFNHATINKWMRKRGHLRGKGYKGNEVARGKGAAILKERCRERIIAKLRDDGDTLELLEIGEKFTLRCKTCGHVFNKSKGGYQHRFTCPQCHEVEIQKAREDRERKRFEHEQQMEAAREWRLSVPRVCKECGEPFYSIYDKEAYCCSACRKRVANRNKAIRIKGTHRSTGKNRHKRRMRIAVTSSTYDRTVTLDAVYKKYHGRCCNCGCKTVRTSKYDPRQATLDHKIALANNGTHTWDNVQLLCSECNSNKRDTGQMRLAIA